MSENTTTESTQIALGEGFTDVGPVFHEGQWGILLRPRDNHISVGDPGELQNEHYEFIKGDVVIWLRNSEGADVLQNTLNETQDFLKGRKTLETPAS